MLSVNCWCLLKKEEAEAGLEGLYIRDTDQPLLQYSVKDTKIHDWHSWQNHFRPSPVSGVPEDIAIYYGFKHKFRSYDDAIPGAKSLHSSASQLSVSSGPDAGGEVLRRSSYSLRPATHHGDFPDASGCGDARSVSTFLWKQVVRRVSHEEDMEYLEHWAVSTPCRGRKLKGYRGTLWHSSWKVIKLSPLRSRSL